MAKKEELKYVEFITKRTVRYKDTDASGITHFSNYLVFCSDALLDFFFARGLVPTGKGGLVLANRREDEDTSVWWGFGEVNCRYKAPAEFNDALEIGVGVKEITSRKVVYGFECYNRTTNKLCAIAHMTTLCIDKKTGRSVDIPEDILVSLKNH